MSEGVADGIRHLVEAMNRLELQIAGEAEIIKVHYVKAAAAMPEDKNYFLSGMQTGSVIKSYLLTRKGIDVHGEGTLPIPEFIDSVLKFANCPKRKIEVLSEFATHLQNIYALIGSQEAH
ncbi:MAG TPA: hypothetical protein VGJ42_03645 [Nitrososphaera sp.]